MRVLDHTRNQVKQNWATTKTVTHNAVEFYDALCLATVSGFAIYVYLHTGHKELWDYALGLAGVTIALQAFLLLVRTFNKQPNKEG